MASTIFRTRNINTFRKSYPYVRKSPDNIYFGDGGYILEVAAIDFSNDSSVTYNFFQTFPETPVVTMASLDSSQNGQADIGLSLSDVSTTACTIQASNNFTGKVHVHILYVP